MKRHAPAALLASALWLTACNGTPNPNLVVGELASDRIELTAEAAEPIIEILVAEGESVEAGQVLMRQDASRARANLAHAAAAIGQAQARLDELVRGPRSEQIAAARANVTGAADELAFRESDFARIKKIHAMQLAAPELLDQAKAALDAARANNALRRAQLQELLSGTTVEELAQAEQALKQAQALSDLAEIDLERREIRAPVAGVVDSRLFELGEKPMPGQVLMVMLGGQQPYARVYVPEALRIHVTPGSSASVSVDGLNAPLTGRVRWVSSDAAFTPYFALTERDRGRLTYEAKIDLPVTERRLPDGVPVEVDLGTGIGQ
jgi:HlyD family secretion protein